MGESSQQIGQTKGSFKMGDLRIFGVVKEVVGDRGAGDLVPGLMPPNSLELDRVGLRLGGGGGDLRRVSATGVAEALRPAAVVNESGLSIYFSTRRSLFQERCRNSKLAESA